MSIMVDLKSTDTNNSSSFSFPADKKEVGRVVDFINGFLEKKDMNSKIISQIDIAVDEICSNIFNYAYKDKKGQVLVEISYKDNAITIRFVDTGVKFNPLEKEDPDVNLSLQERKVGGLGIYLVKQLMDDVKYEYSPKKENILTVIKKVGE